MHLQVVSKLVIRIHLVKPALFKHGIHPLIEEYIAYITKEIRVGQVIIIL